jgi:hypothetical protein
MLKAPGALAVDAFACGWVWDFEDEDASFAKIVERFGTFRVCAIVQHGGLSVTHAALAVLGCLALFALHAVEVGGDCEVALFNSSKLPRVWLPKSSATRLSGMRSNIFSLHHFVGQKVKMLKIVDPVPLNYAISDSRQGST